MKLVEGYFDTYAQDWCDLYDTVRGVNDLVLAKRKDIAIDFVCRHLAPPLRILDAGCGTGPIALALAHRGFFVHGVDISGKMVELCKQNFSQQGIPASRYAVTQTNILKADLPEGGFDGIVALGFLQYQSDEEKVLKAFNRLLRSGGILVVSGPVKITISNYFGLPILIESIKDQLRGYRLFTLARKIVRRLRPLDANHEASSHQVLHDISRHTYTSRRFKALLSSAGFEHLSGKGHGYVGFPVLRKCIGFKGELLLHRFFTALSVFLPIGRWANDLIVLARKQ